MRKLMSIGLGLLLLRLAAQVSGAVEMTWEYSVQVSATVQTSPPQITLSWPQDQNVFPNSYTVYRKAPGDSSWGAGVNLPAAPQAIRTAASPWGRPTNIKL